MRCLRMQTWDVCCRRDLQQALRLLLSVVAVENIVLTFILDFGMRERHDLRRTVTDVLADEGTDVSGHGRRSHHDVHALG